MYLLKVLAVRMLSAVSRTEVEIILASWWESNNSTAGLSLQAHHPDA